MKNRWLPIVLGAAGSVIVLTLVVTLISLARAPVSIQMDGQEISLKMHPQFAGGGIFPIRWVAEATGSGVFSPGKKVAVGVQPQTRNELEPTYYPRAPVKISTPEMAVKAYFDALYYASNLDVGQMGIAGGTVGDVYPYQVAYNYWSRDWQAAHGYAEFLASWRGTAHVDLLQLLPAGTDHGQPRFFVETRQTEVGQKASFGLFYYYGFYTLVQTPDGWRIASGSLQPENLAYGYGGHQPWRMDPEQVAQVEIGSSSEAPLDQAQVQNNADGTATVGFIDRNGKETHRAVLAKLQEGTWLVIAKT